jgi:hypothetical protein
MQMSGGAFPKANAEGQKSKRKDPAQSRASKFLCFIVAVVRVARSAKADSQAVALSQTEYWACALLVHVPRLK